jgi:D-glycero-D-manno-heptose 1,7-bisphosphate phosphatase
MQAKAVFLDRDGVLIDNHDHYYIWKTDQMKLVDGVIENLKLISAKGYLLFIVSNQGGISKQLYTNNDIQSLHIELHETFNQQGINIKAISFCPHHPEIEKCLCRKPDSLMIEKLLAKYKVDPVKSYFIGDSQSDMEAASNAGIRSIRIPANQNMKPYIVQLL